MVKMGWACARAVPDQGRSALRVGWAEEPLQVLWPWRSPLATISEGTLAFLHQKTAFHLPSQTLQWAFEVFLQQAKEQIPGNEVDVTPRAGWLGAAGAQLWEGGWCLEARRSGGVGTVLGGKEERWCWDGAWRRGGAVVLGWCLEARRSGGVEADLL